jgi:hypothetical protein
MDDFLKYWRVIRQYVKVKHGLTQSDLDVLFFLYSEKYFSKDKFEEFDLILSWEEGRFKRLKAAGWIESFRAYNTHTNTRAIYQLSLKAKRLVGSVYKMLKGEQMPTTPEANPLFKSNAGYMNKRYRRAVTQMNAELRQRQRPAHE